MLMVTDKQRKLANAIVENLNADEPLNGAELLEAAGYSEATAEGNPGRTIEQKGVQYELRRLGFDADNAKRVVGEILNKEDAEDRDRLKAAEQVFKVTGAYAPEKSVTVNLELEADSAVKKATEYLNALYGGTSQPSNGETTSAVGDEVQNQE